MKFSKWWAFYKIWPNPQESAGLVTFTKEILNGNLYFFVEFNIHRNCI